MAYSGEHLRLTGFDNKPIYSYPAAIYDNNGKLLGYADNSAEVVTLWNGSAVNQALGSISATTDNFIFLFQSPKNSKVFQILATAFTEISSSVTLIGTSYFTSYAQTVPYLHDKIKDYFLKTLTGYTVQLNNNGKVSHDRLRRVHELIDGINYPDALFFYWNVNDLLYQDISEDPAAYDKAQLKVKNSHYTALANCFSGTFHPFVDEITKVNTTNFTDTDHTFGAKCGYLSKNILVLPDNTAHVEFIAEGKTNIVYFVSDGISENLGTFEIYVNDLLYETVVCDEKTVDLTGLNDTIPTEGDSYCSPNSIVLNLPNGPHKIKIQNTTPNPVWLDYWSDIVTDTSKGAKPVYAANVPSFVDGWEISSRWTVFNATMIECNTNLQAVYDFFRNELGAPVALADVYTAFNPNTMYSDQLHFNQAGSDHVLAAFVKAVKDLYRNTIVV